VGAVDAVDHPEDIHHRVELGKLTPKSSRRLTCDAFIKKPNR
jgi:hypothetical protein